MAYPIVLAVCVSTSLPGVRRNQTMVLAVCLSTSTSLPGLRGNQKSNCQSRGLLSAAFWAGIPKIHFCLFIHSVLFLISYISFHIIRTHASAVQYTTTFISLLRLMVYPTRSTHSSSHASYPTELASRIPHILRELMISLSPSYLRRLMNPHGPTPHAPRPHFPVAGGNLPGMEMELQQGTTSTRQAECKSVS